MSIPATLEQRYLNGDYLVHNPDWHASDSPWKAEQVLEMLHRNGVRPRSVCEIGCGVGQILECLYTRLPEEVEFVGYDIAPEAITRAKQLEKPRLQFQNTNLLDLEVCYDLVLTMDVVEHVKDCYGFLHRLALRGRNHIFHFPLEINALRALRPGAYLDSRSKLGHIHYFSKDTALAALRDTGYEVIDWFYTRAADRRKRTFGSKVLQIPRRLAFHLAPDSAVRMLGGYPLLVLARAEGN